MIQEKKIQKGLKLMEDNAQKEKDKLIKKVKKKAKKHKKEALRKYKNEIIELNGKQRKLYETIKK